MSELVFVNCISGRSAVISQEDQADIPTQRKACRDFAEKMGWEVVHEEHETGVSGFKGSAEDRGKLHLKLHGKDHGAESASENRQWGI